MADVHNKQARSYNMSRVKNKDTMPELLLRKFLHKNGFRYLIHDKRLPGKPDIVLPKYNTVIFINGCFWHGHKNCRFSKLPQTNSHWWSNKIQGNVVNDRKVHKSLVQIGWNIITIWTCGLKASRFDTTANGVIKKLRATRS